MNHPDDHEIQSDAEAEVREAREEAHCTTCRDPEEAAVLGHSDCYDRIMRDQSACFDQPPEEFHNPEFDAYFDRYDDDPNPYHGTYSED